MDNFIAKLLEYEVLKNEIDNYIWDKFKKYINTENINFSDPDYWELDIDKTKIHFHGKDGCMGCYDPKHISIDIYFFT
jgi:hypothetical protein